MSMFQSSKPRGFQHHYLYVDERKERLKEIQQRAMMADKKSEFNSSYSSPSSTQGLFRKSSRQKQSSHFTFLLVGLFCLVILIALLLFVTTVLVTPANF